MLIEKKSKITIALIGHVVATPNKNFILVSQASELKHDTNEAERLRRKCVYYKAKSLRDAKERQFLIEKMETLERELKQAALEATLKIEQMLESMPKIGKKPIHELLRKISIKGSECDILKQELIKAKCLYGIIVLFYTMIIFCIFMTKYVKKENQCTA